MYKAVFLDKDGTLIEDVPYNVDPEKIRFTPGCVDALKLLHLREYKLIVITNQPGVAMGYCGVDDIKNVENALQEMIARHGVRFAGFYYCPHHPEAAVSEYRVRCGCRKPEPGLILRAAEDHDIDLSQSWFIGDILNDIEAGRRAGCRTILIDNGNETEWLTGPGRVPHHIVRDLLESTEIICICENRDPGTRF
jgi:histidinol-phosphate phosphatase family protein